MWEIYGVNVLDIWELPADYFFGMASQVDQARAEAKVAARKAGG